MSISEITLAAIIGVATVVVSLLAKVIGQPAQIRKNFKRKSTEGLSTTMIIIAFTSYVLWIVHGILRNDPVVIIGQGLGVITMGIVLGQIVIYKKK